MKKTEFMYMTMNLNLKNGFKIKLPNNKINENTINVSDDFKYLLLSVPNYLLNLWDVENKKLLQKYECHQRLCIKCKNKR